MVQQFTSNIRDQVQYSTNLCNISNPAYSPKNAVNSCTDRFILGDSYDSVSTSTFSIGSSDSTLTTIQEEDANSIDITGFEKNDDYEKCKSSAATITRERLYLQVPDRRRRLAGNNPTEYTKVCPSSNTSNVIEYDNIPSVSEEQSIDTRPPTSVKHPRNGTLKQGIGSTTIISSSNLNTMDSAKSMFDTQSSRICGATDSHPKAVRWGNLAQIKEIKFDTDTDNIEECKKVFISEIACNRLYLEGLERAKRLALLRNSCLMHCPKLSLAATSRPSQLLSNDKLSRNNQKMSKGYENLGAGYHKETSCRHKTSCTNAFQRLYALSKPMQEDGKKRRENAEKPEQIKKEMSIYPKDKISIPHAVRLYYIGMKQLVNLEHRRMKASGPDKSPLVPTRLIKLSKCNQRMLKGYENVGVGVHKVFSHRKSSCTNAFQRLYALSKPMQEDGKKRRENVGKSEKIENDILINSECKISIAHAVRLYYIGMRQLVNLEHRRMKASGPGLYKSPLIPTL